MSPDNAIGTAILKSTAEGRILWVLCASEARGYIGASVIPLVLPGDPPGRQGWKGEILPGGGVLKVAPSLRISTSVDSGKTIIELFHNGGLWMIPFVHLGDVTDVYASEEFHRMHGDLMRDWQQKNPCRIKELIHGWLHDGAAPA